MGVEPTRPRGQSDLSRPRLPVTPPGRGGDRTPAEKTGNLTVARRRHGYPEPSNFSALCGVLSGGTRSRPSLEVSALTHAGAAGHARSPLLRLQSDERLIALIRRGNHHAFEALVARYQARLLAFCRHMLSSREDAEDVLQEVFAAAFNAILADDRPINVRPWLYRIARNRSLNHLRKAQAIGVDSMDVHLSEHGLTTADKVHKREEFRQLMSDVQDLPETQRTALLLREIDALSYEQIAEAMETTVPSVKSLLVRARVVAGRGGRGAAADLRGGARRARRGRRGPAPHDAAGAPPPAHLRALPALPQAAAPDEQGAGRDLPGRAAAAAQEDAARARRRRRRRDGRRGRGRQRRRGGRRRRGRAPPRAARCRPARARSPPRPWPASPPRRSSPRAPSRSSTSRTARPRQGDRRADGRRRRRAASPAAAATRAGRRRLRAAARLRARPRRAGEAGRRRTKRRARAEGRGHADPDAHPGAGGDARPDRHPGARAAAPPAPPPNVEQHEGDTVALPGDPAAGQRADAGRLASRSRARRRRRPRRCPRRRRVPTTPRRHGPGDRLAERRPRPRAARPQWMRDARAGDRRSAARAGSIAALLVARPEAQHLGHERPDLARREVHRPPTTSRPSSSVARVVRDLRRRALDAELRARSRSSSFQAGLRASGNSSTAARGRRACRRRGTGRTVDHQFADARTAPRGRASRRPRTRPSCACAGCPAPARGGR